MQRKGFAIIHIEPALDRLEALGVLNDEQFARTFVRSKVLGRGTSMMAIRRDLGRKGISRELADQAINEVMEEQSVDESDVARTEATKRWRTLSKLEPAVAKRRLIGFLQRRGFPGDVIRTVVRELAGR
jgi:regulatory protein